MLLDFSVVRQSGHNGQLRDFAQLLRRFQPVEEQHAEEGNGQSDDGAVQGVVADGLPLVRAHNSAVTGHLNDGRLRRYARTGDDILRTSFKQEDVELFIDLQLALHDDDVPLRSGDTTQAVF